jgi:hypothetical protein
LLFIKLFSTSKSKSDIFSSFIKIAHDLTTSLAWLLESVSQDFVIVSNKFSLEYLNHHIESTKTFISSSFKFLTISILFSSSQNIKFEIFLHNSASAIE